MRTNALFLTKTSLIMMAVFAISSCVSNKDVVYLQGASNTYRVPQSINKAFELRTQPDDLLAISVNSKNKELINPFDNTTLIGSGSGASKTGYSNATSNTTAGVTYFKVDEQGMINFPIFGNIKVGGLTTNEISQMLQEKFVKDGYINDAVVNTKIMSFKVTVLGDVKNPGPQTYSGERLTVLEAIGKAGDLTNSAIRQNVLVVREENGQRTTYELNLLDEASVFQSPAYYLHRTMWCMCNQTRVSV